MLDAAEQLQSLIEVEQALSVALASDDNTSEQRERLSNLLREVRRCVEEFGTSE